MYRSVAIYCILLGVSCSWITILAQSNYASHANNVEYQGEGLPEEATLDGKVSSFPHFVFLSYEISWGFEISVTTLSLGKRNGIFYVDCKVPRELRKQMMKIACHKPFIELSDLTHWWANSIIWE